MLSKEQLLEKLSMMGLDVYETISDVIEDTSIQLVNFEELCRFIKNHNIDTVFYHYSYVDEENLQIDDEILEKVRPGKIMLELMEQEIEEYNESVCKLDFSKPYWLSVYFTYQNFMYYIEEDYWFQEEGFETPKLALINIMSKYLDKAVEMQDASKVERQRGREKLREQILNDEEFYRCTNQRLRGTYITSLLADNAELQALFRTPEGRLYDIMAVDFIEIIWKDYKEMQKS